MIKPLRAPFAWTPLAPLLILAAGLSVCGACSPDAGATESGTGITGASAKREVRDLIAAVTPFSPTLPVPEKNAWWGRREEILKRLRAAGPEVGREALRVYHERRDSLPEIRAGLLDVAAHAAPEETRPVLVDLVTEYGDELFVRTQAVRFLGETAPAQAVEVLEPILRNEVRGTYPPDDHMLEAWNAGALATDYDRLPLLCDIATDQKREQSCRHLATRLLAEVPGEQSRQALEFLLLESSGNQYIRRVAAQSLQASVAADELCPILKQVIEREADPNFQIFLDNMLQQNCP